MGLRKVAVIQVAMLGIICLLPFNRSASQLLAEIFRKPENVTYRQLEVLAQVSQQIPQPEDFFSDDYTMTISENSGFLDEGTKRSFGEWRQVDEQHFLLKGFLRVAPGDLRSGWHFLLLKRCVKQYISSSDVRYEPLIDCQEPY